MALKGDTFVGQQGEQRSHHELLCLTLNFDEGVTGGKILSCFVPLAKIVVVMRVHGIN